MTNNIQSNSRSAFGAWRTTILFLLLAPLALAETMFYAGSKKPTPGIVEVDSIVTFDRIHDTAVGASDLMKKAIVGSTVLLSGTVIVKKQVVGCWSYDWTTTVLGEDHPTLSPMGRPMYRSFAIYPSRLIQPHPLLLQHSATWAIFIS